MAKQPRMPNMQQMMQQVQKMQKDMELAQEELKNEVVEASAGGGMVRVKMSGDLVVREVRIDPSAVDPEDVEILADMVLAAVNEALRTAQQVAERKMGGATGGLDLGEQPGQRLQPHALVARQLARRQGTLAVQPGQHAPFRRREGAGRGTGAQPPHDGRYRGAQADGEPGGGNGSGAHPEMVRQTLVMFEATGRQRAPASPRTLR